eukprot:SAG25_NODE_9919_length_352_cov_1.758893_1_plen_59_part_10
MACLLMQQQQCGFFYWDEIDCLLSQQQQYEYRCRGGVSMEARWPACLCSSSAGIFYWDG